MQINLLENFERTVKDNNEKIAVKHRENKISFGELKDKAQKLGTILTIKMQKTKNHPIAVFLPKEINTVIADIGIMYSSNFFMNLDVKTPRERIDNILKQIEPIAIITDEKNKENLDNISIPCVLLDCVNWEDICVDEQLLLQQREGMIDTDPLCIINTSGSTGTPKGVVLNHRSFFDFMTVSNEKFAFCGSEVLGSLSPVVFDIFNFEMCMMMFYGSQLVLLDSYLASFPARLLEMLVSNNISLIFWVPSIMVTIANMRLLEKIELPDLKMVWFAGEVFPTKQFLYWFDNLPQVRFVNLYGPIEITLDCTYYEIKQRPEENEPLPIGIPYKNTDILILNDKDRKCAIDEEGELCVRGTSLAMGYYNNTEKTAEVFVQNPLNSSYPELIYRTGDIVSLRKDGNIIFKGRKDSLIKHMGYRIELGEIEHVIENKLKLVKYCCAVYQYARKEIILYYENEQEISIKEFRVALKRIFPAYMIPNIYERMDMLPRNVNGKIDRYMLKTKANREKEILFGGGRLRRNNNWINVGQIGRAS